MNQQQQQQQQQQTQQTKVTPEFNQESFEGMSQSDEEMEVVESAETMEGVEEEGIVDERPLCLVKLFGNLNMTDYGTGVRKKNGLPYGPRGGPNTPDKLYVIDAEHIREDVSRLNPVLKEDDNDITVDDELKIKKKIYYPKIRDVMKDILYVN
ncbi:hypothetical protein BDC45DRAFT_574181 [Circinella umbellata]|nr:hypothetical protein BDC45DRAFT_574181 [Circinella umbellata]